MPIDSVSKDLEEWATTLKNEVKLWIIKKYIEFGYPENVLYEIPDEYRPFLDTQEKSNTQTNISKNDITLSNLIDAGLLNVGATLHMSYSPRNGRRKTYDGIVQNDGSINIMGKSFPSPSYAALYGIQDAGSDRKTVNGWVTWKDINETLLSDLREKYLKIRENQKVKNDSE